METTLLFALIVLVALAAFAFVVQSWLGAQRRDILASQQATEQRLQGLDRRFDAVQQSVGQSLGSTAETMTRIGEQLGALGKSAERILEVGQDISALQDILQAPKLRGGFGELLLERLLEQVLPGGYSSQHRFRGGDAVDAVIRLRGGLVPVDSKFPLESFNRMSAADSDEDRRRLRREFERAVRVHVEAVARYIRPDEGTLDFALMYIPAERVFYELATSDGEDPTGGVFSYAQERRVFPVSPATMYVYVASIGLGLRGMRVEEKAREIIDHLGRLTQEFGRFQREFEILGGHVDSAKKKYDSLSGQAERFANRLAVPLEHEEAPGGEDGQPYLLVG
jgi:DNA recombination protein RmuC